jgi:integrase
MSTDQRITFAQLLAALELEIEHLVRAQLRSPATLAMHRLHIRYLCDVIAPTTPIAEIDERAVNCVAVQEARGRRLTSDGSTRATVPGTVAKRVCTLRLALELARRRGWITRVPAFPRFHGVRRPRREFLRNPQELAKLCAALPLDRADWVYVALFTGQHPSDVHRMRAYDDADPFAKVPWFRLRNTKNRRPEVLAVMPDPLAERLRAVFNRRELAPGDPIVVTWEKDNRSRTLRLVGRRLGLLLRRATDLRHTAGSWAAHELGTLTVGLKDFLGHSSFEMLSRTYAHALPPALGDVAAALTRAAGAHKVSPGAGGRARVSSSGRGGRKKKTPTAAGNSRRGR